MKLYPQINNNYAGATFGIPNSIRGPVPVVSSNQIDLTKQTDVTKYVVGTLMAKSSTYATTSNLQIFDSTLQSTRAFAGVFFDEAASSDAFVPVSGEITSGFFEIATQMNIGTLFNYLALTGFNSGTTDIDYLITNGYASVQTIVEGGVPVKWVQFTNMITGA